MTDEEKKIQRGDIIHLEYDLWIHDDNILFDTTHKELADKHEITDEKATYKPIALIVDEGKAVTGLYKSLLDAEVGEDYEIEVSPEDGLGIRDPKLVEWHMMNEIKRQKLEPAVGKQITIKDKSGRERTGVVTMLSPRRIRVDYNNPLAGKTLRYNYKVVDRATELEDKVLAILEMDFGRRDEFEIANEGEAVEIKLPDVCKYDQFWLIAKYKIVNDLREYSGFNKIRFIEEYVKKEEEEKEEKEGEEKDKEEEGMEEKEEGIKGEEKEEEEGVKEKEEGIAGEEKEEEGEEKEEEKGGEEKVEKS
ncbi:MAG: FKBP-type peptidyl-prolyl cis-trans isomerase [Thermoplasmata archaeon]|nr:MAG: FKBP-type peptidyl-prolyl cis-trans isomerase [Thermoplasmata archaeon]